MTTKKPSLTKQIAEVLDTEDKREQLSRIKSLKQATQTPVVAVTVLFSLGRVRTNVISGGGQVTADDVKYVLNLAVDDITEQALRAKLEEENRNQMKLPLDPKDVTEMEDLGPQTGDVSENGDITP